MINLSSPQLENCRSCGALYLRDQIDCCLDCYRENEEAFKKVDAFLKNPEHRNASIEDVNAFTGVSMNKVVEFLREGRIFAADYPLLGYPCAHCETLISRQLLCGDCQRAFRNEAQAILNDAQHPETLDKRQLANAQYWKMKK